MIRAALRTLLRKLREGFALLRRLPHIYYALVLVGIVGSGALTLLPIVADPNERWKIAVLGGIVIIVWTLVVLVLQSAVNRHAEAQAREIVADDVQPIKEELITLGGRLTTVEALLAEIQHRLIQINAEVDLPEMTAHATLKVRMAPPSHGVLRPWYWLKLQLHRFWRWVY